MKKSQRQRDAALKLKEIRSVVSFDYDLRSKLSYRQIKKIEKYYNEYQTFANSFNYVYRPKSKKHLRQAQLSTGIDKEFKQFKVAFIPTAEKPEIVETKKGRVKVINKPKISFSKTGDLQIKSKFLNTKIITLDQKLLTQMNKDQIGDYIKSEADKRPLGDEYVLMAGKSPFKQGKKYSHIKTLGDDVYRLMQQYDTYKTDEHGKETDEKADNHYSKWLKNIEIINFTSQEDYIKFKNAKKQNARERKAERKKMYMREYRAKLKK
jgi:hypothetical protein